MGPAETHEVRVYLDDTKGVPGGLLFVDTEPKSREAPAPAEDFQTMESLVQ